MHLLAQKTDETAAAVTAAIAAMTGGMLLFGLVMIVITVAIYYVIIKKTGYNPLLALLILIPGIGGLIVMIMLAFTEWPIQRENRELRSQFRGGGGSGVPGPGASPYPSDPILPPPPGTITQA
ncbi:MAG: hypothetical protein NVS4B13_09510 [Candidatus Elarobacter sp.]